MGLKYMRDQRDAFYERVGVFAFCDFEGVDISPCYAPGYFSSEGLERLKAFVQTDPVFHIVSVTSNGCVELNRFVVGADLWLLADGDADPDIISVVDARRVARAWRRYSRSYAESE